MPNSHYCPALLSTSINKKLVRIRRCDVVIENIVNQIFSNRNYPKEMKYLTPRQNTNIFNNFAPCIFFIT